MKGVAKSTLVSELTVSTAQASKKNDALTSIVQGILSLRSGICIVQDDQYRSQPHASKEDRSIFGTVPSKNGHSVTGLNASRMKVFGNVQALLPQIVVRPTVSIPRNDDTFPVSMSSTLRIEKLAEGQGDERWIGGAMEE